MFAHHCASCHTGAESARAPSPAVLKERSPQAILNALTAGSMRPMGAQLSGLERRAVAEYLTGSKVSGDVTGAALGRCGVQPKFDPSAGPSWKGWSPGTANTRFQAAAEAGLTAGQVPRLALKWALGFPDATSAWAQPTVAGGRLFVGSQNGTVYSLDAKSGCIYWTFSAEGGVRTAVVIGTQRVGPAYALYFADTTAKLYAVDAATGREIWSRKLDEHPLARITGSPALHDNVLYAGVASFEELMGGHPEYECCTFRGSLNALDVRTGAVLWKTYFAPQPQPRGKNASGTAVWGPSGAGVWSTPAIDLKRGLAYVGTGNTYTPPQLATSDAIVAVELKTGKIRWINQVTPKDIFIGGGCRGANAKTPLCPEEIGPDFDFGNAPILTRLPDGRDVIVVGQKSGVGYAMDPNKDGAVIWQYRAGQGTALGGMEWGSAVDDKNAYFPISDILLPKPGGLHAVNLATGERVWYAPPAPPKCAPGRGCNAAQTAAITVIPGVVFSGSNDGVLRAYSTRDGSILWEFDTNRNFETLNGVPAKGASMHGGGPAVAGGMLYVNSGYGDHGGRPGNVLLAFEVK